MSAPIPTVVITSIQLPTASVRTLADRLQGSGSPLLIIGDRKGPASFDVEGAELVTLEQQLKLPFRLASLLPTGHYARKNLGYLIAFSRKAPCIYETDDDNAPNASWALRSESTRCQRASPRPWANVYRFFSSDLIWPRGFPLNKVTDPATFAHDANAPMETFTCPIQQGLADLSPDVDAAWRLLLDREYNFVGSKSVWLPPGTWCPFNSQTTWWWPVVYPLMYLPAFCSFRMTDIWRSFVAQRCLWELGHGMAFHASEVVQERNVHNLMRDFEQEIPGYLQNEAIIRTLAELKLEAGPAHTSANLLRCYEALVEKKFIPPDELPLVHAWVADVSQSAS